MAKKHETYIELSLIGERLKELRKSMGFTNYEHIAYELNMSRSAYWRIESGENFEMKTLIKICKVLGVTMKEFFEGIEFPRQAKKPKKA
jgi:transcriptional regulator with XRE-family HTH domain